MYYRIDDIARDGRVRTNRAHARIVVYFSVWPSRAAHDRGDEPLWTEDFHMDLRPTRRRIATDRFGRWQRTNGTFVNPRALTWQQIAATKWRRETVANDVAAEIRANIAGYLRRNPAKQGDQCDKRVRKRSDDPRGVLTRSEVQQLKGTRREVTR